MVGGGGRLRLKVHSPHFLTTFLGPSRACGTTSAHISPALALAHILAVSTSSYSTHWHAFLTGSSTDATFLCPDYFSERSFFVAASLQVSGMRVQELGLLTVGQHKRFSARTRGVAGSDPRIVKPFGWMKILLSYHYWRSLNLVVWITLMTRSEETYSP